ncbi:MAG: 4Fe-4S binding protein [Chloroflexaceae bacterium]|jgi:electron transfer flavoprotein alpha subunit|nr:4Fe-4S binding protein [Chloroflexaceae bacterium]
MPAVMVNTDRCNNSQTCLTACPYNAIGMVDGPVGQPVAFIYDNCIDCMLCVPACPAHAIQMVGADGAVVEQEVHSGIWVLVFDSDPASVALVRQAKQLATPLGTWTGVVFLGQGGEGALQSAGADVVVHHQPNQEHGDLEALTDAVAETIAERQPEALLLPEGPIARELAARLAWRLQLGLVTDVYEVENDLSERRLLFHKWTMDSPVSAVVATTTRPQLALLSTPS